MRKTIPGTRPMGSVIGETRNQIHARLYPGPADLDERPRYYVTRRRTNREYLKVWPKIRWPSGFVDKQGNQILGRDMEAAACMIAGDPYSLCTTSASPEYLYRECRRVTVPLEMPEPWCSCLIPLSIGLTKAAIDDLFENPPCPQCGFKRACPECRAQITARYKTERAA